MKNTRGYLALSAIITCGGLWAVGCGTSNGGTGPVGTDAPSDSIVEDSTMSDAPDGSPPDTGDSGPDATSDAPIDSPADVPVDVPSDVPADVPADVPTDALDAGADAPDSSAMYNFRQQLAQAICERQANCCFPGNPSHLDMTRCESDNFALGYGYSSYGTANTNLLGPGVLDRGNVVFNATSALACLGDIAAIDCTTNTITSAESIAIYRDCYGAYQGTLPAGAPCINPIECAPGEFCGVGDGGAPTDAGIAGICQALESDGGPCGQFAIAYHDPNSVGPVLGETACSYRGSGGTGLFCFFADLNTGAIRPLDAGPSAWSCTPSNGNGTGCNNDIECRSKLCDPGSGYTCVNSMTYLPASACATLPIVDAGGGG